LQSLLNSTPCSSLRWTGHMKYRSIDAQRKAPRARRSRKLN
jgi:hypothetical protein